MPSISLFSNDQRKFDEEAVIDNPNGLELSDAHADNIFIQEQESEHSNSSEDLESSQLDSA